MTTSTDDRPIGERIADLSEQVRLINERARTGAGNDDDERERQALQATIAELFKQVGGGELSTPTKKTETAPARITMRDPLRSWGFGSRIAGKPETYDEDAYVADVELAAMIFDGATKVRRPLQIKAPQVLADAFRKLVLERPDPPMIVDDKGQIVRALGKSRANDAMDTAESGFGLDLVQTSWGTELWRAARDADPLVQQIRQVPMAQPTHDVPIDTTLPEMLFVGESTASNAAAYATSNTGSSNRALAAKKFTIQQMWSGELNEDSIIPYTPFLREQLAESLAQYTGSAMYNGDTTNAGNGNINTDDADPGDTKHYLAFDGIRHRSLVDDSTGLDVAAAITLNDIWTLRGRMKVGDDDIDNAVDNRNWGKNLNDLVIVCDWDTYMSLLALDEVTTVDKYGPAATVIAGELGRIAGIRIVSPAYASKTEADGKASTTEASNTKGQLTLLNVSGWLRGVRREMQLFFDRVQGTDQFMFELYTRIGFQSHGSKVAVVAYDITV